MTAALTWLCAHCRVWGPRPGGALNGRWARWGWDGGAEPEAQTPQPSPAGAPAELGRGCTQEARRRDSALGPRTRGLAHHGRDETHQEKVV